MTRFHYLVLGYGLIWLALGFYLFKIHARLERLQREVTELERLAGKGETPGKASIERKAEP